MLQQIEIPRSATPVKEENGFKLPTWECYCCHDSGFVSPNLIRLVCPEYSLKTHPPIFCKACYRGNVFQDCCGISLLSQSQCLELADECRRQWIHTARHWQSIQPQIQQVQSAIAQYTTGYSFPSDKPVTQGETDVVPA